MAASPPPERSPSVCDILCAASPCPKDVVECIFQHLEHGADLAKAGATCKLWRAAARAEHLWEALCTQSWPSTARLELPRGFRLFYAQRRRAEAKCHEASSSIADVDATELCFLVEVRHDGKPVFSRPMRLPAGAGSAPQSELLLETDDDVQGFVHGSWEEWCEQRQKSSSWQISLSVLRQDGRIAHLGSTHAAKRVRPTARWGLDGMSGPYRCLVFAHSKHAPMASLDDALGSAAGAGSNTSAWEGCTLLQHDGPLPGTQYVIAPRLELHVRPSEGWSDPTTGAGSAEVSFVSVKFEIFTPGAGVESESANNDDDEETDDATDDEDDDEGIPRPPSALSGVSGLSGISAGSVEAMTTDVGGEHRSLAHGFSRWAAFSHRRHAVLQVCPPAGRS